MTGIDTLLGKCFDQDIGPTDTGNVVHMLLLSRPREKTRSEGASGNRGHLVW